MILGMGFPALFQKFQEERYLDAVCPGLNGIEATSPPSTKLPLLNHRSVTTIETRRSRTASNARKCIDARFKNELIWALIIDSQIMLSKLDVLRNYSVNNLSIADHL